MYMKMAEMFSSLKTYGTFRPEDGVYVTLIPGTIGIAVIGIISSFIFVPRGLQFLLLPPFPAGAAIYLFMCHRKANRK
jgi:hypothetical protein